MSPEDMAKLMISVEHGVLCIRDSTQWLLLYKNLNYVPLMGFTLESIRGELEAGARSVKAEKAASKKGAIGG